MIFWTRACDFFTGSILWWQAYPLLRTAVVRYVTFYYAQQVRTGAGRYGLAPVVSLRISRESRVLIIIICLMVDYEIVFIFEAWNRYFSAGLLIRSSWWVVLEMCTGIEWGSDCYPEFFDARSQVWPRVLPKETAWHPARCPFVEGFKTWTQNTFSQFPREICTFERNFR